MKSPKMSHDGLLHKSYRLRKMGLLEAQKYTFASIREKMIKFRKILEKQRKILAKAKEKTK